MRRLFRSIGLQLFLWIFGATMVVFLTAAYLNDRRTTEAWEESFEHQSNRMAAVVDRALRFGMLLENKEAVERTLEALSEEPGIQRVRIYDKKGVIAFSTSPLEVGQRFAKREAACSGCHVDVDEPPDLDRWTGSLTDPEGERVLDHIHVIENEQRCSAGDCHVSPEQKPLLGTLEVRTSLAPLQKAHRDAQTGMLWATLLMALAGGASAWLFIWRFVRRPMRQLIDGTRQVASGDLSGQIRLEHRTEELVEIASAFNRMTRQLREARERTEAWERDLEEAVEKKTAELSRVHRRMTHMEKMASLGKLSATVAHELNNPLAGIMVYAKLIRRDLEEDDEARHHLDVIVQETGRCGDIVKNLLTFARESAAEFADHDLNEIVRRALGTVQHLLRNKAIDLQVRELEGDTRIRADGNQIQQALVALLINAVEAMPNGGELEVDVAGDDEKVRIHIHDTGVGIHAEVLPSIFEPFVSTKADKGVGLGLSVVYGIARRHGGAVEADSEPGRGTTMKLLLPRRADSRGGEEAHDAV